MHPYQPSDHCNIFHQPSIHHSRRNFPLCKSNSNWHQERTCTLPPILSSFSFSNFLYCMLVMVADNDRSKNRNVVFCGNLLHVKSELDYRTELATLHVLLPTFLSLLSTLLPRISFVIPQIRYFQLIFFFFSDINRGSCFTFKCWLLNLNLDFVFLGYRGDCPFLSVLTICYEKITLLHDNCFV